MLEKKILKSFRWALTPLWVCASVASWAASVQSVSGSQQGGGDVVRIELSEPLSTPITGFVVQSPARIALDLHGVTNAMGQSVVELQQGNLETVNVVEGGTRTRVVLNLKAPATYRTQEDGNTILVFLDPVTRSTSSIAPAESSLRRQLTSKEVDTTTLGALQNIDFRRGSDGAGRLVVDLGSDMVNADVRKEGKGITIDLFNASLPEALRRNLDVMDFATPVQMISVSQHGDRVRLLVEAAGDWIHNAYQSNKQFVLEVRPKKEDPNKLSQGPGFSGERLSLNFQNIDVRALLQVIADFTNFNIVTSDTVGGALTLRLKDVPWDQALNIIMEAKGLGMKKNGNVLWIAPKDEIDERAKRDYEAARAIEQLEPLRTQGFQLNYAKALEIAEGIAEKAGSGESSTRFLSPRGSVIAESRTNQLFVTDIPSKIEELTQLIKKLDIPVRQVLIEARIVDARDSFGRSLGVKFGGGYNRAGRGSVGSQYASYGTKDAAPFVNLPAGLSTGGDAGTLALSVFNSTMTRFLSLELSAMEAEGAGRVISSPRLLTADQREAQIAQGTEVPYAETAPNGATTVAFKKAELRLQVKPQITPEGNIILTLKVNKDSVAPIGTGSVPAIDTKRVETEVLVENGGTVVIGGIFEMEESNQLNKVPLLGDIPVMGNLFKSRTRESSKREMLVFITPRMVADVVAGN